MYLNYIENGVRKYLNVIYFIIYLYLIHIYKEFYYKFKILGHCDLSNYMISL